VSKIRFVYHSIAHPFEHFIRRSTIERPPHVSQWLDRHADHIQVLILQNYLFFGNASSILNYITSMFEEPDEENVEDLDSIPPMPRIVILDLTLVTGMDTSAVDAFADIVSVCTIKNNCKVFLAGVATGLREIMQLNGLKPEITRDRSKRQLRFFQDLESAIGKAEDCLIDILAFNQNRVPRRTSRNGFVNTLCLIDGKHEVSL
jgi:MFS superfamily sulfate permease-like transporter